MFLLTKIIIKKMQKNVLNILPKKLLRGEREELFEPENTPFIGLFFSSNWCGPCKLFFVHQIKIKNILKIIILQCHGWQFLLVKKLKK